MIVEELSLWSKKYFVTGGDANIFGADAEQRRGMTDEQVAARFASVWTEKLEPELRVASQVDLPEVRSLLKGKALDYALEGFQFRQFSIDQVVFIARLNLHADRSGTCDQLWSLGAHRDPLRLCVRFKTEREIKRFEVISTHLGKDPKDLALELLLDFTKKFSRTTLGGKDGSQG